MKRDYIYLIIIAGLVIFMVIYWSKPISAKVNMSISDILKPGGWGLLFQKLKFGGKLFGWEFQYG